jgi:hypothetical protein
MSVWCGGNRKPAITEYGSWFLLQTSFCKYYDKSCLINQLNLRLLAIYLIDSTFSFLFYCQQDRKTCAMWINCCSWWMVLDIWWMVLDTWWCVLHCNQAQMFYNPGMEIFHLIDVFYPSIQHLGWKLVVLIEFL